MWEAIAAIAVPLVTGGVAFFTSARGAGRERRLRHHLELAELAKGNAAAKQALDELAGYESAVLLQRGKLRADRKLNVSNLSAAIVLALLTSVALYGGFSWLGSVWGQPIAWLTVALLGTGGLFLVLLTAAGFASLYNPPRPKKIPPRP